MYLESETDPLRHVYDTEDADDLRRVLGDQYHVVVGNPPYITVKDRALSDAYRKRFGSCYRQYSLAVPFMERFFDLAIAPRDQATQPAGYVGMITANSFMKREFGKRLIEEYIPRWDLTHVIDTSGAYIPGHGTPTVILFGRHRPPVSELVRAVLGLAGEPSTPDDPSHGLVWSAILDQIDRPGSESLFVSVADMPRASFESHPWSIGGGGAADIKNHIDDAADHVLRDVCQDIGACAVTREDEAFGVGAGVTRRNRIPPDHVLPLVAGENIRDWSLTEPISGIWPYDSGSLVTCDSKEVIRFLWPWRPQLSSRVAYGKSQLERGLRWYEYSMFFRDRFRSSLIIAFAEVATHNHFMLNNGGKVFKQTAPVITLPPESTEEEHLTLLGVLNSSVACFWLRQVCFPKGGDYVGNRGARVRVRLWDERFAFNSTNLEDFPIPSGAEAVAVLAKQLDELGVRVEEAAQFARLTPTASNLRSKAVEYASSLSRMIALQEELDWLCYGLYGLVDRAKESWSPTDVAGINLGQRAFEIVMARKVARGDASSEWFERHGSVPVTEIPAEWPSEYRDVVAQRIALIERNLSVALVEQPEYKRRWNIERWEQKEERALREWLLERLEIPETWSSVEVTSVSKLADRVRRDAEFMQVAELYRGRADFDVTPLVAELVESDAVPFLPVLRYRPTGLRKRAGWEHTWDLQRREDAKEEVGEIPVPPMYTSADFLDSTFWSLRGKLDVPKERFISYPHAERDSDQTMVIGWAGWDRLEQAKALAAYYVRMKDQEGWAQERLKALLAGLLELIPWLKQWHNDLDPTYGIGMGDYFSGFVDEEARALGFTVDDVRAWQPPARNSRRRRRASV